MMNIMQKLQPKLKKYIAPKFYQDFIASSWYNLLKSIMVLDMVSNSVKKYYIYSQNISRELIM